MFLTCQTRLANFIMVRCLAVWRQWQFMEQLDEMGQNDQTHPPPLSFSTGTLILKSEHFSKKWSSFSSVQWKQEKETNKRTNNKLPKCGVSTNPSPERSQNERSGGFISWKNRVNKYSVEQHIPSPFLVCVHMELVLVRSETIYHLHTFISSSYSIHHSPSNGRSFH